jgi:hypothetical protein
LNRNGDNLDNKENQLKTIEHFVDRYIPIRVQKQIAENLMSVLSSTQALKFENFQMEKYKQMNKDLLDEETNSDLIALCKTLLVDIDNAIDLYRKVAKARG